MIGYFGYGSLVNRDTLRTSYVGAVRAELHGFRREWGVQSKKAPRKVSGLTVTAEKGTSVQGLLVIDFAENLPDVDERERNYDRIRLSDLDLDLEDNPGVSDFYVYLAKPVHRGRGDPDHPILQSYLDAVLQGYRREFGDDGLKRFVTETHGWTQPVLQDRHDPVYARAVDLSEEERVLFDALVAESGAWI